MKPTFMQVGTMLQETAQTREEATKRFCESCDRCWKAGQCNESVCPIAKMHQARLLYFDAQIVAQQQPKHKNFVKVREYKTTPQAQKRKRVKSVLNKVHQLGVDYDTELALDQAEVYAEDERYEDIVYVLNRASLKKLAKHIALIAGLVKEDK